MTNSDDTSYRSDSLSLQLLANKVREKGIIGAFMAGVSRIFRVISRPVRRLRKRILKRNWIPLGWVFPSLRLVTQSDAPFQNSILVICDFRTIPFTVGELLWFQAYAMMLRIEHKADKIDLVWLCDPERPARWDEGVTPANYHYHLSRLLPLAYVNPYLGSFLLMDSSEAVEMYVKDNLHRYSHIAPSFKDYAVRRLTYLDWYAQLLDFHRRHGYVPQLSCKPGMLLWARSFIRQEVRPHIPIVVHMRNDRSWARDRNARFESWLEFFEFCRGKYEVKFLAIGTRDEIDPRARDLDNLIFTAEHGTTVEQDMALIQSGLLYLGSTSGPAVMASLSGRPYAIFNYRASHTRLPKGSQHPFAAPMQKLVWEPETTELLIAEFTKIFHGIDSSHWAQEFDRLAEGDSDRLQRYPDGIRK